MYSFTFLITLNQRKMKNIILCITATCVVLLSACAGNSKKTAGDWPEVEKQGFMDECVKGAAVSLGEESARNYCDCMLTKVIEKYPNVDDAMGLSVEEMGKMAEGCVN
jgi:hypothetical protein